MNIYKFTIFFFFVNLPFAWILTNNDDDESKELEIVK